MALHMTNKLGSGLKDTHELFAATTAGGTYSRRILLYARAGDWRVYDSAAGTDYSSVLAGVAKSIDNSEQSWGSTLHILGPVGGVLEIEES